MGPFFGDLPVDGSSPWMPEPLQRGTYSLLSSCLITMGLCVWTAVHLNIPEHGKESHQKWLKLKWLIIGLLAPELIALTAFQQRMEAFEICNFMRECNGQPLLVGFCQKLKHIFRRIWQRREKLQSDQSGMVDLPANNVEELKKHPWTLTHGFYAVMGGYAFDLSDAKDPFLPQSLSRLTITPSGLRFISRREPRFIPEISKEDIQDKSKANSLVKIIVCLQASWFCLQCIFRLSQQYPISLLELNVFGHSICTLVIYLLWWEKPFDVEQPLLIRGADTYPICALMCFTHCYFGKEGLPWSKKYIGTHPDLFIEFVRAQSSSIDQSQPVSILASERISNEERLLNQEVLQNDPALCNSIRLKIGQSHRGIQLTLRDKDQMFDNFESFYIELDKICDNFWSKTSEGIDRYISPDSSSQPNPWRVQYHIPGTTSSKKVPINQEATIIAKWYENIDEGKIILQKRSLNSLLFYRLDAPQFFTGFGFASLIYGALHLVAWNAPFATQLEQLLWRISALGVVSTIPACWLSAIPLFLFCKKNKDSLESGRVHLPDWPVAVITVMVLFYVLCRTYLVVECFINIAHLPPSVYELPSWSSYFPHIG